MSATLSCDLLKMRLPYCEVVLGSVLAGGRGTDATPGDRRDSNGALDEAKEATEAVDGRRAMQCSKQHVRSKRCQQMLIT